MSAEELIRPKARILLIEDEEKLAETLADYLGMNEYQVVCAFTGDRGLELFYDRMHELDLILLDIMLPGIDGFELMDYIRSTGIPVIFLTAKNAVADRVKGLRMGAEDYMVKPFDVLELLARVDGVLRRHGKLQTHLQVGDLEINTLSMQVLRSGEEIPLTRKEYELLLLFARNVGVVLSKATIYERVWGGEYPENTRTVELHIQRMKKKVGWDERIKPVYGMGYRLEG